MATPRYDLRPTVWRKRMRDQQYPVGLKPKRRRTARMKLTDLVDDCLIESFQHLNIADLSNVYEASPRFKYAAVEAFKRIGKRNVIKVSTTYDAETKSIPSVTHLERFGDLIQKLEVSYIAGNERYAQALENAIETHCRKLSEITLIGIDFFGFAENSKPFENVTKICIDSGFGADIVHRLNTMFPNAQSLDFFPTGVLSHNDSQSIAQHFPSLIHFGLNCYDDAFSAIKLKDAITFNPQLQSLKLKLSILIEIDAELLHHMKNRLPHLRSLSLNLMRESIELATEPNLNFENLSYLSMEIDDGFKFPRIISNRLKCLSLKRPPFLYDLVDADSNDVIKYVSLNKNIRKLELHGAWGNDFPVEEIVKRLPKINELSIEHFGYAKIVQILQQCNKLKWITMGNISSNVVECLTKEFDGKKIGSKLMTVSMISRHSVRVNINEK